VQLIPSKARSEPLIPRQLL
jgi:hypothetical protein